MLTLVFLSTQIMQIYNHLQRFLSFLKIFFDDYFSFLTLYSRGKTFSGRLLLTELIKKCWPHQKKTE